LQKFQDECFLKVQDRVKRAILNQMERDRNNEFVDLNLIKRSIYTFVEMGFTDPKILKEDDELVWKGTKNN